MDGGDRAYLSILGWPGGLDHDPRVETLVSCAGMSPYNARQMARRPTPAIVHLFDSLLCDEILGALHDRGVLALAPTRADVRGYPNPVEPREVERFPDVPGAFAVHDRDGGMWAFRSGDVRLIVAGTVRQSGRVRLHRTGSSHGAAYMFGGVEGLAVSVAMGAFDDKGGGWGANTSRGTRAVDVIDVHLRGDGPSGLGGGRLIRLSGPTARIGVVGEDRGRPSLLDQHRPIEAVRALMPGVPFEGGFESFNTPSDVEALADAAGQGGSRLNPVAFHFYSVWSALIDGGLNG